MMHNIASIKKYLGCVEYPTNDNSMPVRFSLRLDACRSCQHLMQI